MLLIIQHELTRKGENVNSELNTGLSSCGYKKVNKYPKGYLIITRLSIHIQIINVHLCIIYLFIMQ